MRDLPRFANIRDGLRKPVSERVWSVFVGLCVFASFYITTAIAAAILSYP